MPKVTPDAVHMRVASFRFVLILGLVPVMIWGGFAISLPNGPTYSLIAVTERIELDVPQSLDPIEWGGLEVKKIDGMDTKCALQTLTVGSQPMKIIITAPSKRVTKAADEATNIEVRLKGEAGVLEIPCTKGRSREAKSSVVLVALHEGGAPLTLPFAGGVKAGAPPDTKGGPSRILLSGSLRATEKLKGSTQPGASSQYEVLGGDSIHIESESPDGAAASGLIWRDEDGLQLVAHATQARITIDRPGIGRLEQISLRPGLLAILLANPTLFLLCTLLATTLTFLPAVEGYLQRVRSFFSRKPTNFTSESKESKQ